MGIVFNMVGERKLCFFALGLVLLNINLFSQSMDSLDLLQARSLLVLDQKYSPINLNEIDFLERLNTYRSTHVLNSRICSFADFPIKKAYAESPDNNLIVSVRVYIALDSGINSDSIINSVAQVLGPSLSQMTVGFDIDQNKYSYQSQLWVVGNHYLSVSFPNKNEAMIWIRDRSYK